MDVRKVDYLIDKRDVTAAEEGTDALVFELTEGKVSASLDGTACTASLSAA